MQIQMKNKTGIVILISNKIDLKQGHRKRQRRTLHNDNGSTPTKGYKLYKRFCTHHIKQILGKKGEININTVIVGNFNTPLTSMDR